MPSSHFMPNTLRRFRKGGESIKILFCIRSDGLAHPAGDTTLVLRTAEYLRGLGVEVTLNRGERKDYAGYDLIHLFNLTRISETYAYFRLALYQKKTIVLTPIYWDLAPFYRRSGNEEALRLWEAYGPFRQEILNGCAAVYPSSNLERALLQKEYGNAFPQTVVYSGIDPAGLPGDPPGKTGDYILCAARVCPRKNQLALARAAYELGVILLLAGEANNRPYLNRCLCYPNVRYLGLLPFRRLLPLYQGARLHALCGFVETPGLASLEAGACGCNLLSTAEGSAKEYFQDLALYCDPYDQENLRSQLEAGLTRNRQPSLQTHLLENFCQDRCMKPLIRSYQAVLG